MKFYLRAIVLAGFVLFSGVVSSYELATHGAMTRAAFQNSVLNDATFRADLGLPEGQKPFGEVYFDVAGTDVRERKISDAFEGKIIKRDLGADPLSLVGWLMRGAIREDDLGQILGINVGGDPHDDPYGNIFRVYNHFYDPVRDRPLTTIVGVLGQKAPDWGTGSANAFVQPNTPDTSRRNHFTVFDAREAMYRALTGRDSQGNELKPTGTLTKPKDIRNAYWATTFRALGDIVHLVEDMAQPQHTRNDPHSGAPGFGHESVYEAYIDARATGASFLKIDGSNQPIQPLNYGGYPAPAFNKYSDFWSTRTGITGGGLADYSNRGFFSAGTNLGSNDYLSPSNDPNSYTKESAAGLLPNQPLEKINFLRGNVDGASNIRMTTEGLFDLFLFSTKPSYSLNRFNYDDMANLLIPRAVGYSAGLINYFFRGKLDFVKDPGDATKYIIKNLGKEAMTGTFTLYYDDKDDNRHPVPGAEWKNLTIVAGKDSAPVSFTPPTIPAPKNADEYTLVFKGDMGEEKAVGGSVGAVGGKKISAVVLYSAQYDDHWENIYWYKSTDLGKTWVKTGLSAEKNFRIIQALSLGGDTILSVMRNYSGARRSISISKDGGVTWTDKMTDEKFLPWGFAVVGNNGSIILESLCDKPEKLIRRSMDKGVTWDSCDIGAEKSSLRHPVYMGGGRLVGYVNDFSNLAGGYPGGSSASIVAKKWMNGELKYSGSIVPGPVNDSIDEFYDHDWWVRHFRPDWDDLFANFYSYFVTVSGAVTTLKMNPDLPRIYVPIPEMYHDDRTYKVISTDELGLHRRIYATSNDNGLTWQYSVPVKKISASPASYYTALIKYKEAQKFVDGASIKAAIETFASGVQERGRLFEETLDKLMADENALLQACQSTQTPDKCFTDGYKPLYDAWVAFLDGLNVRTVAAQSVLDEAVAQHNAAWKARDIAIEAAARVLEGARSVLWKDAFGAPRNRFLLNSPVYCENNILVNPPFRSTDGGISWVYDETMAGISELVYLGKGILIGWSDENLDVYRSTDYGATWVPTNSPLVYPWHFAVLGNGRAVVTASDESDDWSSYVYLTEDAGITWKKQGRIGNGFDTMPIVVGGPHINPAIPNLYD